MEYQSLGRYQKPKGSNVKQVLKMMLLLAVCAWLLYQIKKTETKKFGIQIKLVAGCGHKLFGRKGMLSRPDERAFPDSGKVDSVGEVTNEFKSNDKEKEVQLGVEEKGNKMQKNEVESAANNGVIVIDEVQSFHDENGVPPDGGEENMSTFRIVNWLKKISIYEVTYGEDNDIEMNLEGTTNATTVDEEINTGTTVHVDTSGLQSRNRWR